MKKLTDFDKEVIRVEVQNAICENLDLIEVIDNLEDFGLTAEECKWAKENLDYKVIIL
jgi:hypothetical protein